MGVGSGIPCPINLNPSLTRAQKKLYQNPETIQKILHTSKTIAIVGLSTERQKVSYPVATYLRSVGYRIIPVNPGADRILGEKSYPNLSSIPEHIDLVDIFRPPVDCLNIVKEAIDCKASAVWMQLKIINLEAAGLAQQAGLPVVMDLCVKMEHERYNSA
jgi:predicted CoA-binding protein